ncbi:MAG TPA: aminopeptidase [Gaiellales bacterium]|nr:aminopeptidase [Gaiellales bacterium]
MSDPRLRRLAEVVTGYSLALGEGDLVLIQGPALAEPLLVELARAAVERGAVPKTRLTIEGADQAFLSRASDEQLGWLPPYALAEINAVDATISIHADWNTRELAGIDPARIALRQGAVRSVTQRFLERSAEGSLRWCVTAFPCEAFAQDSDMSLTAYEDFVYGAGWLDADDPIAAWSAFAGRLTDLTSRLEKVRSLRVVAEDTDLTVGVGDRTWIASYGSRNFPDGEVFTGPIEDATSGHVRFSFPAAIGGREVNDVRLRFENGRVVESEARTGQDYLRQMLALDDGASSLGEFAIGTNYAVRRFTKQILFDEKMGGTCHMALGAGYPNSGSRNRSALHWDMVCDLRSGGEIHADGEPIYRDGRFLPAFFEHSLDPPAAATSA